MNIEENRNQGKFEFGFCLSLQFVAGLIALIFQGQETRVEDIMNINGALFILLTNITFQNVYAVVNVSHPII